MLKLAAGVVPDRAMARSDNTVLDSTAQRNEKPLDSAPFVVVTDDADEIVTVEHPAGNSEAGLNLTKFPGAAGFQRFLDAHHLEGPYPVPCHPEQQAGDTEAGDLIGWGWADEHVVVLTGANPLTGVRARVERLPELGYASYVGIKGTRSSVATMFYALRRRASYCKGADPMQSSYLN